MNKFAYRTITAAAVAAMTLSPLPILRFAAAADAPVPTPAGLQTPFSANATSAADAAIEKSLEYLKSKQQPDGGWQTDKDFPALTALALTGVVSSGKYSTKDDFVKKGYEKLFSYQMETGGIYQEALANYNTAIAVSAIAAANDAGFKDREEHAVAFLKRLQWVANGEKGPKGEQITDPNNPWYGGWGYGNHSRPDLSNAHFAIEALHDAGLKADDPAFKAAQEFVTRCQNDSETNKVKYAGDDGGFIYGPANGDGDSEAGFEVGPNGQKIPRSYGTMTYAGLKSMLYAGVKKDDPRVVAAVKWIEHNWSVDENPGMRLASPANAKHGLYYYYDVYAKALRAYGEPVITDSKGVRHDWRVELINKLVTTQKPDGSWTGEKRWMESDPVLATAYALLAMEQAQRDFADHPLK